MQRPKCSHHVHQSPMPTLHVDIVHVGAVVTLVASPLLVEPAREYLVRQRPVDGKIGLVLFALATLIVVVALVARPLRSTVALLILLLIVLLLRLRLVCRSIRLWGLWEAERCSWEANRGKARWHRRHCSGSTLPLHSSHEGGEFGWRRARRWGRHASWESWE